MKQPSERTESPLHTDEPTTGGGSAGSAQESSSRSAPPLRLDEDAGLFEKALEDAPIGIALVAPDGRWLKVNPALCEIVGYPPEKLLTLTFQDITHPDDLGMDLEGVEKLLAKDIRTLNHEKRYIRGDGRVVPVLINVSVAWDGSGKSLYFVCHIQDVSARKEQEERLRAREQRYHRQRDAMIAFGLGEIAGSDISDMIRSLTEVAARTLEVARVSLWLYTEDRKGIRCIDLFDSGTGGHSTGMELYAKDFPGYFRALESQEVIPAHDAHTDPRTSEFSEPYLRPLGINSMLDAPVNPGTGIGGVLCHEHVGPPREWTADEETFAVALASRLALLLEAAERRRVAEQLRMTLDQLGQMLAHSPAITFQLRLENGRFVPVSVSDNLTRLLGYTLEEAFAPGWWLDNLHPEDRDGALQSEAAMLKREFARREYRFRHKDGSYRWIEDNQRVVRDFNGEAVESVGVWLDVTERKLAEAEYEKLNEELITVSRKAGMAEVATSVLHNVGNVLNSVNVASSLLADRLRKSKSASLLKGVALLEEHQDDLVRFLTTDPRGQALPQFLQKTARLLAGEEARSLAELEEIQRNIDHIKQIVAMQQSLSGVHGTTEAVDVVELVEQCLRMDSPSFTRHHISLTREFDKVPHLTLDKHRLLQILINLIQNAKDACVASGTEDARISIRVTRGEDHVRVLVSDNGVGIASENLSRIFAHGFTTKPHGHGFGLHSSALRARELGGSLTVHSDGPGTGATFTLELPVPEPLR